MITGDPAARALTSRPKIGNPRSRGCAWNRGSGFESLLIIRNARPVTGAACTDCGNVIEKRRPELCALPILRGASGRPIVPMTRAGEDILQHRKALKAWPAM